MILVNNLMAWTDTPRFPRLAHAQWNGCTLADLIFPFLCFLVGVTAVISLDDGYRKGESLPRLIQAIFIRRRALFPGPGNQRRLARRLACSVPLPSRGDPEDHLVDLSLYPPDSQVWYFSLANLRIMGVLQRIALVYLAVAILVIHTRWRLQAILAGALLLLYWGLMGRPGFRQRTGKDLGAFISTGPGSVKPICGEIHSWDPESLLGTLPAIATGPWPEPLPPTGLAASETGPASSSGFSGQGSSRIAVGWVVGTGLSPQQVPLDQFLRRLHCGLRPDLPGLLVLAGGPAAGLGGFGYSLPSGWG